jgi:hypothetical protein
LDRKGKSIDFRLFSLTLRIVRCVNATAAGSAQMKSSELKEGCARLLNGALKHARKAGLAAALVPLGAIPAQAAFLEIGGPPVIESTVTPVGSQYAYAYSIKLAGGFFYSGDIFGFGIPLFSMTEVESIVAPVGWSGSITTAVDAQWDYLTTMDSQLLLDPLKYGPNPEVFESPPFVLTFSGPGVSEVDLSGFGFISDYGPANAPFLFDGGEGVEGLVDPLTPLSPERMQAQGVPEPSTFALVVMAGITAAGAIALRRKS